MLRAVSHLEILVKFANAVRRHWGGLAIGGAPIGVLAIWESFGHHVPAWTHLVVGIALVIYLLVWLFWPKHADRDLIEVPKYANVYVEQVIGEYESLPSATRASSDQRATQIIEEYRSHEKTTWGELYGLERLLVQLEKTEALHARILSLRARHAALVGAAGPPLSAFDTAKFGANEDKVRAYVDSALREVNRLLAVTACRERLRKRRLEAVAWIGISGLLAFGALIISTVHLRHLDFQEWPWLVPVPFVGALGGLISSQRRVQSIPSVGESLTDMTNLHFFRASLTVSAVSGAVFAVILYVLFASELMQGDLFPTVNPTAHMSLEDLAKLLIWCFIAGFAERFVPDTLDRLVSKSAKDQ